MFRVRVMRTREIGEWRPVVANRGRVKLTVRARLIRVVVNIGLKCVPWRIVMILALDMGQIVLCCFCD